MQAAFSIAIIVGTLTMHYSVSHPKPRPLTYTWAKSRGMGVMGCSCYSLYQGSTATIVAWFVAGAGLFQVLSWEDFWDWNC